MQIKSPFTGGEVVETQTTETYTMRGQELEVTAPCYQCVDTGEQFTTDDQDEVFMREQDRVYRERNRVPAPADLKTRREEIGLSARETSRLLGFGVNQFSQYEAGELPSESNTLLLQLFCNPLALENIINARMEVLPARTVKKLQQAFTLSVRVHQHIIPGVTLAPLAWTSQVLYVAVHDSDEPRAASPYAPTQNHKVRQRLSDYSVQAF